MVRLTDRPDMTLDVYRGRKTTIQPTNTQVSDSEPHGPFVFSCCVPANNVIHRTDAVHVLLLADVVSHGHPRGEGTVNENKYEV